MRPNLTSGIFISPSHFNLILFLFGRGGRRPRRRSGAPARAVPRYRPGQVPRALDGADIADRAISRGILRIVRLVRLLVRDPARAVRAPLDWEGVGVTTVALLGRSAVRCDARRPRPYLHGGGAASPRGGRGSSRPVRQHAEAQADRAVLQGRGRATCGGRAFACRASGEDDGLAREQRAGTEAGGRCIAFPSLSRVIVLVLQTRGKREEISAAI